ncbi:MAG: hypothetical protein JRI95_15470 [Deltaproteobacteria bacterium]|nr:hypothetical protein [Deltaproteobacteria bacterium]
MSVEIYRLEKWRKKALAALSSGLKERGGDLVQAELDAAMKRIGEGFIAANGPDGLCRG